MPEKLSIHTNFSVFYDSTDNDSALSQHSISVSQLSAALVGINGAIREANRIVNGEEEPIEVRIAAGGFEEGSFGIPIEIIQDPAAIDVLRAIGITVFNSSIVLGGALGVIQKLKGRKVRKIERVKKESGYTLSVDGETIACSATEKRLVTSKAFRKHVDTIFSEPLENSTAEIVRLQMQEDGEKRSLDLNKAVAQEFAAPDDILQSETEHEDTFVTVRFKSAFAEKSGGWIIDMFGKDIKVEILDKAFLSKLNSEDAEFSFGRKFEVTLRETTTIKGGIGRRSKSYAILTVHREV
jgi:hypothetical protein